MDRPDNQKVLLDLHGHSLQIHHAIWTEPYSEKKNEDIRKRHQYKNVLI